MLATTRTWYGVRCTADARSRRPVSLSAWANRWTIATSTRFASLPGSMSYVAGNRKPSALPPEYAGSPKALGFDTTACREESGIRVACASARSVWSTRRPSGIRTREDTRDAGSRMRSSAAAALICRRSLYVPGRMSV